MKKTILNRCRGAILSLTLTLFATSLHAAVLIPKKFQSALAKAENPGVYEDENYAGIYNQYTGILFEKKGGHLVGIWDKAGWTSASNMGWPGGTVFPLWKIETLRPENENAAGADSRSFPPADIRTTADETTATIRLVWRDVMVGGEKIDVEAAASLDAANPGVRWKISVPNSSQNPYSIWSVVYPCVAVPAFDSGAHNRLAAPVRRGVLRHYGSDVVRFHTALPYPGPSAKYQFLAAYGDISRKGLYYAVEDGEGYSKVFRFTNEPAAGAIVLEVEHLPANRGLPGTGFASPYEVVTAPLHGDWWDAARIYRGWWMRQTWAAQGLLMNRKDIPEAMRRTPIWARFSTSAPGRTIESNVAAALSLSKFVKETPFYGTWYAPFGETVAHHKEGLFETGHGHTLPVSQGIRDALKVMDEHGIRSLAYIQSMIYDANFPGISSEDIRAAQDHVLRDRKGEITYYGTETKESGKYAMNRGSDWWQRRIIEQAMVAMQGGFRGIYLDSFGKGEPENFAKAHGRPVGGGNKVIADQRIMASRILDAIRKVDPEAVLSGEGPVEAFRDLIQVNLYAVNVYTDYIPVARTVWGDYSLGHGRVLRFSEDTDGNIAEMGRLFVDGDILGRIFCNNAEALWKNPDERAVEKRYLEKAINFTKYGLDYLRFGESLRPIEVNAPPVEFKSGATGSKTAVPAVMNSVTRSHRDGSVAIVFTNVSAHSVTMDFDPGSVEVGKTLYQVNEQGEEKPLSKDQQAGKRPLTIAPYDIVFYVLK